jgi:hypothetical protein
MLNAYRNTKSEIHAILCYPAAMRKTTFVRPLSCCIHLFCLVAFGMICLSAFAQDSTSAAAPAKEAPAAILPSDPKELMLLAAKTNGLTGPDVQPWHLKVSFTLLDEQGNVKDQGTYEEFRASEHKYKIAYTSAGFSQTDYGTEKGILRSGAREPAPGPLSQLRNEFTDPLDVERQEVVPIQTCAGSGGV